MYAMRAVRVKERMWRRSVCVLVLCVCVCVCVYGEAEGTGAVCRKSVCALCAVH